MLYYGIVGCINAFKVMNIRRQVARLERQQQTEAEVVDAEAEEVGAQDVASGLPAVDATPANNAPEEPENPNAGAGI